MKKLLIGLLVTGSLSTFAQSLAYNSPCKNEIIPSTPQELNGIKLDCRYEQFRIALREDWDFPEQKIREMKKDEPEKARKDLQAALKNLGIADYDINKTYNELEKIITKSENNILNHELVNSKENYQREEEIIIYATPKNALIAYEVIVNIEFDDEESEIDTIREVTVYDYKFEKINSRFDIF